MKYHVNERDKTTGKKEKKNYKKTHVVGRHTRNKLNLSDKFTFDADQFKKGTKMEKRALGGDKKKTKKGAHYTASCGRLYLFLFSLQKSSRDSS